MAGFWDSQVNPSVDPQSDSSLPRRGSLFFRAATVGCAVSSVLVIPGSGLIGLRVGRTLR